MKNLIIFTLLFSSILTSCTMMEIQPTSSPTHQVIIISTKDLPNSIVAIDCMKIAEAQFELNECASKQANDAQQKLLRLLEELSLKYSDTDTGIVLLQIQSDWEFLREKDCAWQKSLHDDGSIAPMIFSLCMLEYNLERITELKIFLCEGAGMTAPCEASKKYDEDN